MLVQAIDAHLDDRGHITFLIMLLSQTLALGETYERTSLSAQMKDRTVSAGILPRLATLLETHTTSDVMSVCLSLLANVVSGGPFIETEQRREAAKTLLPAISAGMTLAPHRSAVQHWGMRSVGAILASNAKHSAEDAAVAPAARAELAVQLNLHTTIIDAMIRHRHIQEEKGTVAHEMPAFKESLGDKKFEDAGELRVVMETDGSMLMDGCQTLALFVHGPGHTQREEALIKANAFKAIATAISLNPLFNSDTDQLEIPVQELIGPGSFGQILMPLFASLHGGRHDGRDLATMLDAAGAEELGDPKWVNRCVTMFGNALMHATEAGADASFIRITRMPGGLVHGSIHGSGAS